MDDEKGARFLELVGEQDGLRHKMASSLYALIDSGWESSELRAELERMVSRHADISREIEGA